MATHDEAMTALRNADKAGDTEAATRLAGIANKLKPTNTPAPVDIVIDTDAPASSKNKHLIQAPTAEDFDLMGKLEKKAYAGGDYVQEFASSHGASPEVAGALGAAVPTAATAVIMFAPGGAKKIIGTYADAIEAIGAGALDLGKRIISKPGKIYDVMKGKPSAEASGALKSELTRHMQGAQQNLMQKALDETNLHKLQTERTAAQAERAKLEQDILTERNVLKEDWQKDVALKEMTGQKIQNSPKFKNVIAQIDDKIKEYEGNKEAISYFSKMKEKLQSPNFAGLDVERQTMGSRAYRDALSPQLQYDAQAIYKQLTEAMRDYSKLPNGKSAYGKMLDKWKEYKESIEAFEEKEKKLSRQVEEETKRVQASGKAATKHAHEYENELTILDNEPIADIRKHANTIAKKMLKDGSITADKYEDLQGKIDAVEKLYGKTDQYQKNMKMVLKGAGLLAAGDVAKHMGVF